MQTDTHTETFDPARAEEFAGNLLDTLNRGAMCLMISIGHRTRLFDAMANVGWVTSGDLAVKAGLNERYVREWLAALTVGGIVLADEDGRCLLPPEHAAFLTRAAGSDNIAMVSQYIGELGSVETGIVECFRNGGGVPYEQLARFHELMEEDSSLTVLPALETHILELVPGLKGKLEQGISVLDAGCGRGKALTRLATLFPASRFHGIDLSREATDYARQRAATLGLENIRFTAKDLTDFDTEAEPEACDLVFTFDAVHDQAKPLNLLKGICRTLKADGVYIMQDIHAHSDVRKNMDNPVAPLLYTVSCMHCMSVSLAQGGEGLGTMWGREKAEELLHEAGFSSVDIKRLEHDIQNDWYVVRK